MIQFKNVKQSNLNNQQNITIKIAADSFIDAVEFGRVLNTALETELNAKSFTHSDNNNVEVECSINGTTHGCLNMVKELSFAMVEAFKIASKCHVKLAFALEKSKYNPINLKIAEQSYRQFLLKMVNKNE
jgi:hypothetical protein